MISSSAESRRAYEGSAALWKRLAEEKPLQASFRRDLAACYHNIRNLLHDAGGFAESDVGKLTSRKPFAASL